MKSYKPWEIEAKWEKKWEGKPLFQAKDFDKKKKYYALAEFPYPSGTGLHMGHAFTYSVLDPLVRMKRRQGENVLFPIGWDAFGLPTENYAVKTGIQPAAATAKNTKMFREQMKRLGLSFNWEREVNTTDPDYYRWTQWIFIQLFKHGLAYKQETQVGWCPSCRVILANEEIVNGQCERCGAGAEYRMQKQWLLRITAYADRLADDLDKVDFPDYVKAAQRNWIGKTSGVVIDYPLVGYEEVISCYSTRPDTNFGATFVVVAPEHQFVTELLTGSKFKVQSAKLKEIKDYVDLAKKKNELQRTELSKDKTGVFTGLYCLNRLTGKKIPVWIADFVVAKAGTGMVVGVPAHDERDFAFAKRYGLEIAPVVRPKKREWDFDKAPFTDIDGAEIVNSSFLDGMPAKQAIVKIVDYLVKKRWGRKATNYHLRDWIFSRQHYWGEPIPMVYCEACAKKGMTWWDSSEGERFLNKGSEIMDHGKEKNHNSLFNIHDSDLAGWFPVEEKDLPVKLPYVEKYQPLATGESPLAAVRDWVEGAKCPHCGGKAVRETDTMPNWAGSSWYFLAYPLASKMKNPGPVIHDSKFKIHSSESDIFFENKKLLDYWTPVDLYLGGAEHTTLHVLYSRFWHKFLFDIGLVPTSEPYAARRQHGVILGEDGEKMSKSRGNVVNPEDVSKKFGSDTLRIYLMFMGPYDQTMPWNARGVEGAWRFLNRVWRLVTDSRIMNNNELRIMDKESEGVLERKRQQTIKKVTQDIRNLKHNTAIAVLMEFVNELYSANSKLMILDSRFISTLVLILAPFAPFMAEELWTTMLGNKYSVHSQPWPKFDPALVEEDEIEIVVQVNGKTRGLITVQRSRCKVQSEIEKMVQNEGSAAKYLAGKKTKRVIFVPGRLINFVV